jgi:hypothetical protein
MAKKTILTIEGIEGFCNAANVLIKPFSKALKKARKLNAAK